MHALVSDVADGGRVKVESIGGRAGLDPLFGDAVGEDELLVDDGFRVGSEQTGDLHIGLSFLANDIMLVVLD